MQEAVTVSPMALYYLGVRMKAKYIDYSYIAAMPDIQKRYKLHESETYEVLEKDGYVQQDFMGNVQIDSHVKETLTPVFFGTVESRVHGKKEYNFHVCGDQITAVVTVPGPKGRVQYLSFYRLEEKEIPFFLKQAAGRDGEISIQCADVLHGYRDGLFTREELGEREQIQKAVALIKGGAEENG